MGVQKGRHPALVAGSPILIKAGDAGSGSGMTELMMGVLLVRQFWTASFL